MSIDQLWGGKMFHTSETSPTIPQQMASSGRGPLKNSCLKPSLAEGDQRSLASCAGFRLPCHRQSRSLRCFVTNINQAVELKWNGSMDRLLCDRSRTSASGGGGDLSERMDGLSP